MTETPQPEPTLFERAAASAKKSTRSLGERITNLTDDLRTRLDDEDRAAEIKADAEARIALLRKEIEAEQAKLRNRRAGEP